MSLLLLLIVLKNPVKNEYVFDYAKWIQSSKLKFQYTHTQFQYFLIPCHIIHFWQMPPLPSFVSAGWVTLRVQKSLIIKHRVKVATAQTYRHKLKRNKTHKFTLNLVDLFFLPSTLLHLYTSPDCFSSPKSTLSANVVVIFHF